MDIMVDGRESWVTFFEHPMYRRFISATLDEERTALEVAAVRRWLGSAAGASILDLGCGYGRIAVPLARAGYAVTGIDGSEAMVRHARDHDPDGLVDVIHGHIEDAAGLVPAGFDAVISMSTALGYTPRADADLETVTAAANVLKPGGLLLIDTENREKKLTAAPEMTFQRGAYRLESHRRLDLLTGRWHERLTWSASEGAADNVDLDVRVYTASELASLLRLAGFAVDGCWGWFDGSAYTKESPRMIMLARRG